MLWVRRFPADDPRGVTFTATSVGTGGAPSPAGRGWRSWRHCGDLHEGAAFGPQSIKKKEFPGSGGSDDAFQGTLRAETFPWAPRLRACNCSQIQWVSMVGTGCPVCSSSRGPFGAQTSSFWLSTLPLPLCHPARRPPAAKRILGSAERRKNPPSGVGGAKHSGRRTRGTRGLHPTAFGSPVGRGRPQPALPPNPAAAAPAAGRAAHGGKVSSPWGWGKAFL